MEEFAKISQVTNFFYKYFQREIFIIIIIIIIIIIKKTKKTLTMPGTVQAVKFSKVRIFSRVRILATCEISQAAKFSDELLDLPTAKIGPKLQK